ELEQVAVGVLEVDAAAAIEVVDRVRLGQGGVGPDVDSAVGEARQRGVEVAIGDEEGVVLRREVVLVVHVVEGDSANLYGDERAALVADGKVGDAAEEGGAGLLVAGVDDGVVELDGHGDTSGRSGLRFG